MKKNIQTKTLSVALGAAMIAGLMTGCGVSTSSEDSSEASDVTEEAKVTEEASEETSDKIVAATSDDAAEATATEATEIDMTGRTEVEFWYAGGKTAAGVIKNIVDDFNKSQDKYAVTAVQQADYDETYQKLQAGIAGNVAPDIALIEVDAADNLANKNQLTDLTPFISADADFQRDDYIDVFYNQGVHGDVTYALPAYGTTQVMYYNKEVFEKAGVEPESIKTWQDLAETSKKIKEEGIATYGWEPMWGEDNLIDFAFSNGAEIFSEDGKTVTINSDEWVQVWEDVRTWIHDDEIMSVHSGGQGWEYWYNTMDDAVDGTAGGYVGSSGDQADLDFSVVGAMEQPAWDADSESAPSAEAKELVSVAASSDEEKQGAYEFMKYFTSPENQATWSLATGYVSVRQSSSEIESYKTYSADHPEILVPLSQSSHAKIRPVDPTGGEIYDALKIAADKVELENVPAKEALDEAAETAQKALDKVNQ
jgi:multiple sugar transport system substrate-binding protein